VLRSNDLYRGLPNNFVQFTMLQEVMAGWLGLEVGGYHQWSDSLHIYADTFDAFHCGAPVAEELNSDSLAVPFDRGDPLISEMYARMVMLAAPDLSETGVSEVAAMANAPVGYRNLLRVLAADSARRRGRSEQAEALMVDCTNRQLVQVWSAWLERVRGSSPKQGLPSSSRGMT
jgi:thymidylate synthase